jgi:hypothetical protein
MNDQKPTKKKKKFKENYGESLFKFKCWFSGFVLFEKLRFFFRFCDKLLAIYYELVAFKIALILLGNWMKICLEIGRSFVEFLSFFKFMLSNNGIF